MRQMDYLLPELSEDYYRLTERVGDEIYIGPQIVGIYDVLKAHYLIVDYFAREGEGIGGVGPRDINLLHSALSRQITAYGGESKWTDELDICATLFYGLVKNHAFHDGNKRTALLTALFHLWKLGRVPTIRQKDLEQLALRTTTNQLHLYISHSGYETLEDGDIKFLAKFFQKNTRRIDSRSYTISYRQLDAILRRFNFRLDNPSKNSIDIVRDDEITKWHGFRRDKECVQTKIAHIPFPGMNRQVCVRDIKYVRKLTGLTDDNGVDSGVFFKDADPLDSLIHQYSSVLKRLADK